MREWSETVGSGPSSRSASSSIRYRAILEPSQIRRLPVGAGLLLLRSAPPSCSHCGPGPSGQTPESSPPRRRSGNEGRSFAREPRPGISWSRSRVLRRARYGEWMRSGEWLARRQDWHRAWSAAHRAEPACAVCEAPWSLRHGDLHHRSYDRLGCETVSDLVPLCRGCHDDLHRILESNPAWRRMDRSWATDQIVGLLQRIGRVPAGQEQQS